MSEIRPTRRRLAWSALREFNDARFLRFLCVGFSNFLVSFGAFQLLLRLPWRFSFSVSLYQFLSYAAGIAWSFLWNRRFTFRTQGFVLRQGTRFVALQVSLACFSAAAMGLAVDVWGFPPTASWIAVMGLVTLVNFIISKHWVFRGTRQAETADHPAERSGGQS